MKETPLYVALNQRNHPATVVTSSLALVQHQMTLLISAVRDSAFRSIEGR